MNGYSAFPKAPALLEPDHQIVCVISRTLVAGGGITPLHRWSSVIFNVIGEYCQISCAVSYVTVVKFHTTFSLLVNFAERFPVISISNSTIFFRVFPFR